MDLQIRENKRRWFHFSRLKKALIENRFKVIATCSGATKEKLKEDEHATMWLVTNC